MLLLVKSLDFPVNYYLVLASDEPSLIQCNFTVFCEVTLDLYLTNKREGVVSDAFVVQNRTVHLSAFCYLPVFGFCT